MVLIDYTCKTSVTEDSRYIRLIYIYLIVSIVSIPDLCNLITST